MTFEVEVPVRHRTLWPAFTDPEKTARAVPGLTVDAVHPVPPADGPEGVAGDVVAGRLRLRVGAGPGGATITYRGTACIAGADASKGTLDIAVDVAQARGNGAVAGYLRVALAPAGDGGERTLVSVVPELELSGRALQFAREDWHAAGSGLAAAWVKALVADYVAAGEVAEPEITVPEAAVAPEPAAAHEVVPEVSGDVSGLEAAASEAVAEPATDTLVAQTAEDTEAAEDTETAAEPSDKSPESVAAAVSESDDDALSGDPLATVWQGRYEKNRWVPLIAALTFFLLIKRRRRHRAADAGADSSFRME
ncbi:MAG: hypothetical protein HOV83_24930 [Catenulispora sp.]|nr:hypothetical protein [Catenulispora sp.]